MSLLRDVQSEHDVRNIAIDRVGVGGLSYPIIVLDRERGKQATVADIEMAVSLPHDYRGTHMSRFVETLEIMRETITPHNLEGLTDNLIEKLDAQRAEVIVRFPYFIRKSAPCSGRESWSRYDVAFTAQKGGGEKFVIITEVVAAVQTLCPCSKEISERGAHNQRAYIKVAVRMSEFIWIEELVSAVEECASAPTYTLLKREDEKFVTELAYDNPRFVEDVVREVSLRFDADARIYWYRVSVSSNESIHNHNAFAEVERGKG